MSSGQAEMFARAATVRSSAEIFGSREYLGDDYLSRAVGALLGIFGNAQEEYLGVGWQADANGDGFNGANRYEIRFEAGQMPPVAAFWSITVYTAEKFLYANELDRYVINSSMVPSLAKDGDGGFTLLCAARPAVGGQGGELASGTRGRFRTHASLLSAEAAHHRRRVGCAAGRAVRIGGLSDC